MSLLRPLLNTRSVHLHLISSPQSPILSTSLQNFTTTFRSLTSTSSSTSTRSIWHHRPTAPTITRMAVKINEQQKRGMKVRSSVKKMCDGCKVFNSPPFLLPFLISLTPFPASATSALYTYINPLLPCPFLPFSTQTTTPSPPTPSPHHPISPKEN